MRELFKLLTAILSIWGSQFFSASAQIEGGIDQQERMEQVCEAHKGYQNTPSGDYLANQLSGLTNYYRRRALDCMLPKQSFELSLQEQIKIVGQNSTPAYRREFICKLAPYLATNQPAQDISLHIAGISGHDRYRAINCLKTKIVAPLSAAEVGEVLGPLRPESELQWDGSLETFDQGNHRKALCALAPKLGERLTADSADALLSLTRDYDRYRALRCIENKLIEELSWNDVDLLVGNSVSAIGTIVDLIHDKTPDGRNERILDGYRRSFSSKRFLVEADPPNWFGGQCVEWAKLNYSRISKQNIRVSFGTANNIPTRTESLGFVVERDPRKARIGALIVWDDGAAGHVGIVSEIWREPRTGEAQHIRVSEANWGTATENGARKWGLNLDEAIQQIVTDKYGQFASIRLSTSSLDRPPPGKDEPKSFKFIGYVYP